MADNDSISTNSASEGQETNNESTKRIPKSHELLIKNTFTSLTNNNDDEKLSVDDEKTIKKRVHKAGDILVLSNVTNAKLHTIGPTNLAKKTFCYKMTTTEGVHYFVKIFEDSQLSPTKISKKLFTNKKLKCKFAPYLLLPAFKPQKTPLDTHTYEVVIYPFIKHCNFQDITLKALRQGYINPLYHTTHPMKAAHADGYKWRLLKKFKEVVNIAIVMKDGGNGYCDMDISPDNFIITTSMEDAADNDSIRWDEITDSKQAKCIKIDHESMLKWAQQFSYVQKPMKNAFKPPEVNSKGADDEYKAFDVEKANVYQFGATFVYVLYGQMKATDKDGNVYWKSLPQRGVGDWKNSNWNPKYVTLQWLQKCIDDRPRKRPSYADLLRSIEWELRKVGKGGAARGNRMGAGAANVHRRKVNDFHNRNGAQMINNNGAVTIIHTPHTLRGGPYQRQGHGTYDPYQQQQQQQLLLMQQQQLRTRQRLMQQQQQQQNMRRSQQQFMNQQQPQQQQRDLRRAQLQQNQNQGQQQRRRNVGNNNFNNNQRRKPGNNRRNNF